jgi:uncharacterized membrane protein
MEIPGTPRICGILYVVGLVVVSMCCLGMLFYLASGDIANMAASLGGAVVGLLLVAVGTAIEKLHNIEFYLRPRA